MNRNIWLPITITLVLAGGQAGYAQPLLKGEVQDDYGAKQSADDNKDRPKVEPRGQESMRLIAPGATPELAMPPRAPIDQSPLLPQQPASDDAVPHSALLLGGRATDKDLSYPALPVQPSEFTNGVLGDRFDLSTGRILQIYPGSDSAGRLSVGDVIVAVDHTPAPPGAIQRLCLGQPGTVAKVTVIRNGLELTFGVMRKDWRIFEAEDSDFSFASPQRVGIVRNFP